MGPAGSVSGTARDQTQNWRMIERIAIYKGGTCWGVFAGSGGKDSFTGTWSAKGDKIIIEAGDTAFTAVFSVPKDTGDLVMTTTRSVKGKAFDITLVLSRDECRVKH